MPGMQGDGQGERHGVEFGTFFSCSNGATPGSLLKANIYGQIAVALKGGPWREASMVLMAKGIAGGMEVEPLNSLLAASSLAVLKAALKAMREGKAALKAMSKRRLTGTMRSRNSSRITIAPQVSVGSNDSSADGGMAAVVAKLLPREAREEDGPLDAFICPIGHEVMSDPVTCADGHSYERENIKTWLQTHKTSPLTGAALGHLHLMENHALRKAINEWAQERETPLQANQTELIPDEPAPAVGEAGPSGLKVFREATSRPAGTSPGKLPVGVPPAAESVHEQPNPKWHHNTSDASDLDSNSQQAGSSSTQGCALTGSSIAGCCDDRGRQSLEAATATCLTSEARLNAGGSVSHSLRTHVQPVHV
jgi:hypothetical protein